MRPVHLMDLDRAVRRMLVVPEALWQEEAAAIVERARIGDRYRKRLRKVRYGLGTGTLSSAVNGLDCAPPQACDARYRRCLRVLLKALG